MHTIFGPWTPEDVVVIATSDTAWRVSDLQSRVDDGLALIGFVQLVDAVFQTTAIGRPKVRYEFASLEGAVMSLIDQRALVEQSKRMRAEDELQPQLTMKGAF